MSEAKGWCPFSNCGKGIKIDADDLEDGEMFEDECPGCERPLEITALVLPTGVMLDIAPGKE